MQQRLDVGEVINEAKLSLCQWFVFLICGLLALLDGYDLNVVNFAAPVIAKAWHLPVSVFGLIFGSGIAGLLCGTLVLSATADRYGRKKGILIALGLITAATLLTPLSREVNLLLVMRFLTGVGIGALAPSVMTMSTEFSPKRTRARAVTFMTASVAIGGTLGGLLAARAIPDFGWPSVFFIGGALTLVLIPVVALALPESIRFQVSQGNDRAGIARTLARIVPGRDFSNVGEFVLNEDRQTGFPVVSLFTGGRAPKTASLWAAFFMTQMTVFFAVSWMTAILTQQGLTVREAITAAAFFNAGGIFGPMVCGWLSDRLRPIAVVCVFEAGAATLMATIGPSAAVQQIAPIVVFFAGFCTFGALGGVIALGASVYPTAMRSTGLGWLSGTGRVGSLVGAMLGGVLIATGLPKSQLFYLSAVPPLIAVCAIALLGRSKERAVPEPLTVT
jgi:MFS transporter, AAHS family, 4-hydroxybenzoate transporter